MKKLIVYIYITLYYSITKLMTNDNITDFIDSEYIDYFETIPDVILKKHKASIYNILMEKKSNEIFEYIFKKLPIDFEYFKKLINSYNFKKITIQLLNFFETKFSLESIFIDDQKFINWCQRFNLDICKYIYEKYRQDKCENPLPLVIFNQSPERFVDYKVYIWIKEFKGLKLTSNEKYKIVNKLLEKNVLYEGSTVLTVKILRDYLKEIGLEEKDYLTCLTKNITISLLNSIFIKADEEFLVWFFDKIGLDNKDIFNDNKFGKALQKMLTELVRSSNYYRNNHSSEKIKLIFSYGQIHGIKVNVYDLEREMKYILSSNHYSSNEINSEIVHEIIKLGVCPKKCNNFYDYYKQISIIN